MNENDNFRKFLPDEESDDQRVVFEVPAERIPVLRPHPKSLSQSGRGTLNLAPFSRSGRRVGDEDGS
jgi:hypothetical protein